MFVVDFMAGATMFALVKFILALIFVLLAISIYDDIKKNKLPYLKGMAAGMMIIYMVFGSAAQPKVSISTPRNSALEEYMSTQPDEIVTPEKRIEYLDGFTPLKKETE